MKNQQSQVKRYASAVVIVGTVGILGAAYFAPDDGAYGTAFNFGGQQYYVRDGSQRVVYPDLEACRKDVPSAMQDQCEPVSNYRSGSTYVRSYYGPVYHPSDTGNGYKPSTAFRTEIADSTNIGYKLPSSASKFGFGSTGKAHTSFHGSVGS